MKPRVLVIMGVSGAGKTLIGTNVARRLGWQYIDADDHHPPGNVAKMSAGIPLDDADRAPWLARLHKLLSDPGRNIVLACSALKASYRDVLKGELSDIAFVFLCGSFEDISARLALREGHYMPTSLLRSQFDALEAPPEGTLTLDCMAPPASLTDRIVSEFGLAQQND